MTEDTTKRDLSVQSESIKHEHPTIKYDGTPNKTTIHKELKQANKTLYEAVANSHNLRDKYLQDKAESEPTRDKKAALHKILAHERMMKDWRTIKRYYKNNEKRGMTHVIAPSPDPDICADRYLDPNPNTEDWQAFYDVELVEKIIQARNQTHFGQAQGTPFTKSPLSTMLGWGGTTPEAKELL